MKLLKKCISIAIQAHEGQTDLGDNPYILHPLRVMLQMGTTIEMCVAILHDVLEDSEYTPDDFKSMGIPTQIINAVILLTKSKGESYQGYLSRIKRNELATVVKIADIRDNSNLDRIPNPSPKDYARLDKYIQALKYLLSEE